MSSTLNRVGSSLDSARVEGLVTFSSLSNPDPGVTFELIEADSDPFVLAHGPAVSFSESFGCDDSAWASKSGVVAEKRCLLRLQRSMILLLVGIQVAM